MPGNAAKVRVSERQLVILEEFRRSRTEPLWVVKRADIIVSAWQGESNQEIASHVSLNRLGLSPEIDFPTVEFLGNTGAVALPTALGVERGHVAPGDRVALLGIGSGLSSIMLGVNW